MPKSTRVLRALISALAVVVGAFRPWLISHEVNKHLAQSYQAVAHCLLAGLFTAAYMGGRRWSGYKWAMRLGIALTIIEVSCVVVQFAAR